MTVKKALVAAAAFSLIASSAAFINGAQGEGPLNRKAILDRATTPHPFQKELSQLVLSTIGKDTIWGKYRDPQDGRSYVGHEVCRSCHYDRHQTWSETKMAWAIQKVADFKEGFFLNDSRCLSCHTTGYDPGRDNGGFDEAVREMASVQCEACHGAGSLMAEKIDRRYITRTTDADICGRCHSERYGTKLCFPEYDEWKNSRHRLALETLKNSSQAEKDCLRCHSADAIVPPSDRPLNLQTASYGVTCQACHDPMVRTYPELVDNNQLRRPKSEICQWCHISEARVPDGIPHSPQGNVFSGSGGAEFPGESYDNGPMNAEMDRGCLTCHSLSDRTAEYPYQGHTFMPNILACRRCHPDLATFDRKGVQTKIRELIMKLEQKLADYPEEQKGRYYTMARYNYYLASKDRSFGIHNSDYIRKLLVDSIRNLDRDRAVVK